MDKANIDPVKEAKGQGELEALGTAIDEQLHKFLTIITDWTLETKEKHNLSDEAVCVLLETAPDAHSAYHAEMSTRALAQLLGLDSAAPKE